MKDKELIAIMAAIIFAGADDCEEAAGYRPKDAVDKAIEILTAVEEAKE